MVPLVKVNHSIPSVSASKSPGRFTSSLHLLQQKHKSGGAIYDLATSLPKSLEDFGILSIMFTMSLATSFIIYIKESTAGLDIEKSSCHPRRE